MTGDARRRVRLVVAIGTLSVLVAVSVRVIAPWASAAPVTIRGTLVLLVAVAVGTAALLTLGLAVGRWADDRSSAGLPAALTDPSSGLPGLVVFEDRAAMALALARRNGSAVAFALVRVPGGESPAADAWVLRVGPAIARVLRQVDTVARTASGELAVLAVGVHTEHDVGVVVGRIRGAIEAEGGTARIGWALSGRDGMTSSELTAAARTARGVAERIDAAVVRADSRLVAFDDRDVATASALARAVARTDFELRVADPRSAAPGEHVAARASVPGLADGLVDGLARAIGVDVTIGQWTLATALAAAADWQQRAPGVGVRVTVPGQSLLAPGFSDALRAELAGLGLAPHLLTVLIREAELASNDGRLAPVVKRLRRAGVQVGLAEFGHGYMTLAAIRRIRPVGVELDGGLLADHSEAGAAGLEWALNEARALGLDAWPPPGPAVTGDEVLVGE